MLEYNNILLVRTDRIGDVILTTPAMAVLKKAWPKARVSVLVSPATREIVEGNPHVAEVIVDDAKGEHQGILGYWRLAGKIKRRRFDLAVVLHTKKRTNSLCFFAGIPERVGYANEKFGFFLTNKIPDVRPRGEKHEYQYCLDVLRHLGVSSADTPDLFFPLKESAERWADEFILKNSLTHLKPLIAIHPDASCISKRWPADRFANVMSRLTERYSAKIILVGGQSCQAIAREIKAKTYQPFLDVTGQTTISQLASLLKRCHLLISNDSGPVHVAVAVGTPVISIFGRNQAGLSPTRWRPLGAHDAILHKEVGCEVCLAHNCVIDFECLTAIRPEDILGKIDALSKLW